MERKYDDDPVITKCNEDIQRNPKNAAAYLHRGMRYNELGEYELAKADFKESIQHIVATDPEIAKYTKAIERDPNDTVAYLRRAIKYGELGDHDREIEDYKVVARQTYSRMGNEHIGKGDFNLAVSEYTEAIRLNPSDAEAYVERGDAHFFNHDFDQTIADCTDAIRLNPSSAEAYLERAGAYFLKDDSDHVIEDCSAAIRLEPDYADVYYLRGQAYTDKKEYDLAISDYNEALRLKLPQNFEAYLHRGIAYAGKKEYDKAIEDYTKAIRLNPEDAEAHNQRGDVYARQGNGAKAAADYTDAIRLMLLAPDEYPPKYEKNIIQKRERLKNPTPRKANKTTVNLTAGEKFGMLTILERAGTDRVGNAVWKCRCDCGEIITVKGTLLNKGKKTSCGCDSKGNQYAESFVGKRFGELVVEKALRNAHGKLKLLCRCDCGETYEAYAAALLDGTAKSCRKCRVYTNLEGQRFGRLTVLGKSRRSESQSYDWYWMCRCDCGTEKEVIGSSLKKGTTQSCGCLRKELSGQRLAKKSFRT